MRMFAARAADWLQNRVDYHTNYNISLLTVMDASKIDGEPVSIRYSCQSSDLFEQWWGCSFLSGMSYNTQVVRKLVCRHVMQIHNHLPTVPAAAR